MNVLTDWLEDYDYLPDREYDIIFRIGVLHLIFFDERKELCGSFPHKYYMEEIMTEREKMLAGELYDCGDAELLTRWHKAKDLVRELLGGKGSNLWITAPFFADYGNNIYFGNNCEVNMNCTFLDDNVIRIGDNALIAPNVQIYTAFHPTNAADRFGEPKEDGSFEFCKTQTAPVTIGNNVWIGGGAIIMPGVTIGDNVVIGAGSVVTKDIPDNIVACGNPCRVMRANQ